MLIFVTGSNGFIGKNMVEYLRLKYEILSPKRNELDLLDEGAVRNFLGRHKIELVIHSAVTPGHRNAKDPSNQLFKNTRMFFNLVRNSNRFERMIFLSSGAVYDMRYYVPKMREESFDTHVPIDEHGFSKYICAKYIEQADNIVELRLFGIFGKYEDYEIRFISNAICKTLFDLPITIKQNRRFDYLYIDDLMPVIDYFIENKGRFKSYNVTPDTSIELVELSERIRVISGKDLPIIVAQDGIGIEYSGDNQRLREEISKLAFTPISEALQQLYSWCAKNRHMLNKEFLLLDK